MTPEIAKALLDDDLLSMVISGPQVKDLATAYLAEVEARAKAEHLFEASQAAYDLAFWRAEKAEALVKEIANAVTEHHLAYDRREHGGIADARLVSAVQRILEMPWVQGAALARAKEAGFGHE